MDEIEYYGMQEEAEMGRATLRALRAILQAHGAETLADLQRNAYKYTDAGVSVGFLLHDGTYLWSGDARARDPEMLGMVSAIGVSSIIEGSDAEISPQWLELKDYCDEGGEALVVAAYGELVAKVNDEACDLFREIHGD